MARAIAALCTVEIEVTRDSFHAFSPPDLDVAPGDVMVIHDAPTKVGFGERVTRQCRSPLTP